MKRIVLINGAGKSGKDTFVKFCSQYTEVINYSAIDGIKGIARDLGWKGTKDEKSRKFLSDLKDLADEYNDYSSKCIESVIDDFQKDTTSELLFLHMRSPEQLKRFQEEFPNAISLLVTNRNTPNIVSNHADRNVENYPYDQYLDNSETLEDLNQQAHSFVDFLKEFEN